MIVLELHRVVLVDNRSMYIMSLLWKDDVLLLQSLRNVLYETFGFEPDPREQAVLIPSKRIASAGKSFHVG